MQAFVCNSDGLPMSDTLVTIQVTGEGSSRISRSCVTPVELGKRLLVFSRDGDTDEVKSLISRGAPFTTDWLGTSPLHLAAQMGHTETAEVLLRGGISRDARTKVDRTPLHIAAQEGHTSIVELLLSHGADVDAGDMLRMTPLHWAVERGHSDTVIKLLEHGANPNSVSKFDKTPILMAIDQNRVDILDILQNNSMYINMQREEENTAHFMSQLAEADSAAENLVVELENEAENVVVHQEEEVVHTTHTPIFEIKNQQAIKINFLNSSEKAKTKKQITAGASTSNAQSNIQFLRAHGITMLPNDDSNLVASAMESGQTVVLTEAGKLALNLTRSNPAKKTTSPSPSKQQQPRKVVTITAEQLAALASSGNKIAKIVPLGRKVSSNPTTSDSANTFSPTKLRMQARPADKRVITTTTGKRVFPSSTAPPAASSSPVRMDSDSNDVEEMVQEDVEKVGEEEGVRLEGGESESKDEDDMESMAKKFAEAKREAEEYRKQLLKKEQEAEEYMKKLQSLSK